jgi:hypothetical protein
MGMVAAGEKPRWIASPEGHSIRALCVAPWEIGWHAEDLHTDTVLQERFTGLRNTWNRMNFGPVAQVLVPSSKERIVSTEEPWFKTATVGGIHLWYTASPATGLWLARGMTVVTELDGRPFLFAKGKNDRLLAMRYSATCVEQIVAAFQQRVEEVTVYCLFGAHPKVNSFCEQIATACSDVGMKHECAKRLPYEQSFGYAEHPEVQVPNLGIFSLR